MRPRAAVPEEIKQRARLLRRIATPAESVLWSMLRRRALGGAKFRRQHPMDGFILDFYCAAARLGIELDGDHHLSAEATRQDAERSRILAEQGGVLIMRFRNDDVLRDTARVVATIEDVLSRRLGGGAPDQESEWK